MSKPTKKWQGLNPYRYKDNPMERKLALAWEKFNKTPKGKPTNLDCLLDPMNQGGVRASAQECVAVNTVIQWLGSPVGFAWLANTLGVEMAHYVADYVAGNAYEPAGVQPGQRYRIRRKGNRTVVVECLHFPLGHQRYKTGPYAEWTVRNSVTGRRSYVRERRLLDVSEWRRQ